jgi:hypothetical protein
MDDSEGEEFTHDAYAHGRFTKVFSNPPESLVYIVGGEHSGTFMLRSKYLQARCTREELKDT